MSRSLDNSIFAIRKFAKNDFSILDILKKRCRLAFDLFLSSGQDAETFGRGVACHDIRERTLIGSLMQIDIGLQINEDTARGSGGSSSRRQVSLRTGGRRVQEQAAKGSLIANWRESPSYLYHADTSED